MKFYATITIALATALAALTLTPTDAENAIVIKGNKMFDETTGARFAARGIDYYPRPNDGELNANNIDFFTDDHYDIWSKDIKHIAAAGANAIRLYAVDPSKSHDKFMCALSALGIYVLVDLGASCEGCAITNDAYPTCYPPTLKTRGEQIILAFAKYDNVLAFSAGNEVNHVVADPKKNSPCQKKFIRDMRAFINKCGADKSIRPIPVGVVLADHHREDNAKYYNCRTDPFDKLENAEWYGLNAYQYCDNSVTEMSKATGFTNMVSDFKAYGMSIPVLLTEFGCLAPTFPTENGYDAQRSWLQAGWLHSPQFNEVFSGGFVFEYSTENDNSKGDAPYPFTKFGGQNYGLGYFKPENCNHGSVPCTYVPMPNYMNLAKQYKKVAGDEKKSTKESTPDSTELTPPMCPEGFATLASVMWKADSSASAQCPKAAKFTCPANSAVAGSEKAGNDNDGPGVVHPSNGGTSTTANTATTNNAAGSVSSQVGATIAVVALSAVITAHFL